MRCQRMNAEVSEEHCLKFQETGRKECQGCPTSREYQEVKAEDPKSEEPKPKRKYSMANRANNPSATKQPAGNGKTKDPVNKVEKSDSINEMVKEIFLAYCAAKKEVVYLERTLQLLKRHGFYGGEI